MSAYNAAPLFHTLVSQGQTSKPVFAIKMAKKGSELSLGGLDPKAYSGTPIYTPITQEGHWQINFDALSVEGNIAVGPTSAIVDTVRLLQSFIFLTNISQIELPSHHWFFRWCRCFL
jgi:cathepsin D